MPFIAFLMVLLGALNFVNPRLGWYLSDGWRFRDAEPSDAVLVMNRVLGGIFILVGLVVGMTTCSG